jgi:hypothetical protein
MTNKQVVVLVVVLVGLLLVVPCVLLVGGGVASWVFLRPRSMPPVVSPEPQDSPQPARKGEPGPQN